MANQFSSTISTSAAFGILKNAYAGPIVTQFNDEIPLYKHMENGSEKYQGSQVVRPWKVRRNPGIGAVAEGGLLPSIGNQTVVQATIGCRFNYLRFGITAQMIKASQSDKGAFVSARAYEIEEALKDMKSDVNRQLFWDGTGDLATVSANAVASNVITVTGRESAEDGSKYLDIGMIVDIVNAAGTAYSARGVTISNLSGTTTATLTLDQPVTVAATDVVIRAGSLGNEVQGILTQLDGGTSTLFNVDRSLYPVTQGNVISANGGQLTLNLMQQTYNETVRRGGAKIDAIFCDYDSERMYNKLLVTDKRYVAARQVGDGTFSSKDGSYLEFAGRAIVPDKDCPQRFFFLDSKTLKKYVLSELEWADESGNALIVQTDVDAFESRLRLWFNVFNEKPSASGALKSYISP